MRKTSMNKMLSLLLCIVLIAATALFATGCVDSTEKDSETAAVAKDCDTLGEGDTSFPLTITDKDGKSITVTIHTDKKTVGEALSELGLIEGEQGDYGVFISTVNGIRAVYEEDGVYWGFFIDGEYAMTGVDETEIVDGASYSLVVSK